MPALQHRELGEVLRHRIHRSDGGAFLLAGFRGAGKTTLIRSTVRRLVDEESGRRYLPVFLNIARPMTTEEFLFSVIRRVVETLDDTGLLEALPEAVRNSILLAYARTSLSLTSRSGEDHEASRSLSVGLSLPFAGVAPKLDRGTKTTRSLAMEASFLTYSSADVEHDFVRIVELLAGRGGGSVPGPGGARASVDGPPRRARRWPRRTAGQRAGRRGGPLPVQVVVVIDELDKLTSTEAGRDCIDGVLAAFKNILTAAGAHFIFVTGIDLLDRAVADSRAGIGIYESVFSWLAYVPCFWQSAGTLMNSAVRSDPDGSAPHGATLDLVCGYLEYKGRGVPRRLMQELYGLLRWVDGAPVIVIAAEDFSRFSLYAEMSLMLSGFLGDHTGATGTVEEDRFRLGAYYVADWVLRSEGGVFTADDVVRGDDALSPTLTLTAARADLVLRHIAEQGVIESLMPADVTFIPVPGSVAAASYRMTMEWRRRLLRIARTNERESVYLLGSAALNTPSRPLPQPLAADEATRITIITGLTNTGPGSIPPADPATDFPVGSHPDTTAGGAPAAAPAGPLVGARGLHTAQERVDFRIPRAERFLAGGRYELTDVVGVGGMGTVYSAVDTATGARRAIKVIPATSSANPASRARFQREADIALRLQHRNVVRTYELLDEADGRLGIVMDAVDGTGLNVLLRSGTLTPPTAVTLAAALLDAIGYLHSLGIARLDVKPSNVIVDRYGEPIMVDFGVARALADTESELTLEGALVGTPAYIPPEQVNGQRVDGRADIFSLGLVLYELLGGDPRQGDGPMQQLLYRRVHQDIDLSVLHCSPELIGVIARATARDPDNRFSYASEMHTALRAVPEAAFGPAPGNRVIVASPSTDAGQPTS
ncbi:MAG: protein kinase domain-containing protein [Frankia sp.]